MSEFEKAVLRVAAQFDIPTRRLEEMAIAHFRLVHPDREGELDELPAGSVEDVVERLLGLIDEGGSGNEFLTYLDTYGNSKYA